MGTRIKLLVGTMTGTAELVAQEVQQTLEAAGHDAEVLMMDTVGIDVFSRGGVFIVCTSTHGYGDIPDNAFEFFENLEQRRPPLNNVTYGVIALGDGTYGDNFCKAGDRFDALLTELGARRAGEPLRHDANSGDVPEEAAIQWVTAWADEHLAS
ncbi:MAG: flavodoxin domain-containing protein [Burkholderiales bacterium]|nr:flavodoxin domain-containing protein [Burkholderiales bacterium]